MLHAYHHHHQCPATAFNLRPAVTGMNTANSSASLADWHSFQTAAIIGS